MKRLLSLFAIWISALGISCQAQHDFRSVEADEFATAVEDEAYVVLDVRTAEEHAEGYITGTDFNIDVLEDSFAENIEALLPKDRPIALYCRSGNRSKRAAKILVERGYNVVELATGFNGWVAADKPIEK